MLFTSLNFSNRYIHEQRHHHIQDAKINRHERYWRRRKSRNDIENANDNIEQRNWDKQSSD